MVEISIAFWHSLMKGWKERRAKLVVFLLLRGRSPELSHMLPALGSGRGWLVHLSERSVSVSDKDYVGLHPQIRTSSFV